MSTGIKEIEKLREEFPWHLIKPERHCGNTTRLVDYYIQKLFNDKKVTVIDHYYMERITAKNINNEDNYHIIHVMANRLISELGVRLYDKKGDYNFAYCYFKKNTFELIGF